MAAEAAKTEFTKNRINKCRHEITVYLFSAQKSNLRKKLHVLLGLFVLSIFTTPTLTCSLRKAKILPLPLFLFLLFFDFLIWFWLPLFYYLLISVESQIEILNWEVGFS